jgi:hypothetical protein
MTLLVSDWPGVVYPPVALQLTGTDASWHAVRNPSSTEQRISRVEKPTVSTRRAGPLLIEALRPPAAHADSAPTAGVLADRNKQKRLMRGFFRIMHLWGVEDWETMHLLGNPPERTFYAWRDGTFSRLAEDTVRRIGYVAGIYKAFQVLYSDTRQADGWVRRPNRYFGGQTPLERMAAGDVTDLAAVRAYVDAARAPWS